MFSRVSSSTIRRAFSTKLRDTVTGLLHQEKLYNKAAIDAEIEYTFKHLCLPQSYFSNLPPRVIANNILALSLAKDIGRQTGSDAVEFHTENPHQLISMCSAKPEMISRAHQRIITFARSTPSPLGYSVAYHRSAGTIESNGKDHLGVYTVTRSSYAKPEGTESSVLEEVATEECLKSPAELLNKYRELLSTKATTLVPSISVDDAESGPDGKPLKRVMIAFTKTSKDHGFLGGLTDILDHTGMVTERLFVERFANGVLLYTYYLSNHTPQEIERFVNYAAFLDLIPGEELKSLHDFSPSELAYAHAGAFFASYFAVTQVSEYTSLKKAVENTDLLPKVKAIGKLIKGSQPTLAGVYEVILKYPQLVQLLFADFESKCKGQGVGQFNTVLAERIDKLADQTHERVILHSFLDFNQHIRKTNFFKTWKAALSFRLDPAFLSKLEVPAIPFGLFMMIGRDFRGFHIRFRDIARGGIRMIRSTNEAAFEWNSKMLFDECYNLAFTQQLKNKDIPEGGSKGNFLLSHTYETSGLVSFKKYIDSFLDLLLPTDGVVNYLGRPELIFFGPDEGTADWMEWAALHSKSRGYNLWKSLTTGKPPTIGGIPHDVYGMTTQSVRKCVTGVLGKLGLTEDKVTKIQTGGPDGDLGCNEIRMSSERTLAVVDGDGVVYDPDGLSKAELLRLADIRSTVKNFNEKLLSPKGYKVLVTDTQKTLPDGTLVESGLVFRNIFHLLPEAKADVFVPCGGRPQAVNSTNIHQMFTANGEPKFKVIVEGANLFITEDARLELEKKGVILYKDATANKGGVTSSSYEVLAGLSLTDAEFEKLMCLKQGVRPPFYEQYVKEVQAIIQQNAQNEFDCIWREHERTGLPRSTLTSLLSQKINALDAMIQGSDILWQKKSLVSQVIKGGVPQSLVSHLGLQMLLERVPEPYLRAIFAKQLASKYVYKTGLAADEVAFYAYMRELDSSV